MSIWSNLVGSGFEGIATGISGAIDRFVETEEEKKAAQILFLKTVAEPDKWQAEINKIEAAHRNMFVAGWRPAIGWLCALALLWGWIVAPIIIIIFPQKTVPAIELGEAISLVMAMLGMGALRSYEKKNKLTQ